MTLAPGGGAGASARAGVNPLVWARRLYDWVLHWADTPYGLPALAVIAFAEASFFPVPPDVLLIALCLGSRQRAFLFATVCSVASVAGGIAGYAIGWTFWEHTSDFFFRYVPGFHEEQFRQVGELYDRYAFWAVFTAGLTPIPYKVFTIAAGVFAIQFPGFLLASAVSRSLRFFVVAALIWRFGPPIRTFIDRYFNLLSVIFVVLLAGGFAVVRWLL